MAVMAEMVVVGVMVTVRVGLMRLSRIEMVSSKVGRFLGQYEVILLTRSKNSGGHIILGVKNTPLVLITNSFSNTPRLYMSLEGSMRLPGANSGASQ